MLGSATTYQSLIVVHGCLHRGIIAGVLGVLPLLYDRDDLGIDGLVAVAPEAVFTSREILPIALSIDLIEMSITYKLADPVLMYHGFLSLSEVRLHLRLDHLLGRLFALIAIVPERTA